MQLNSTTSLVQSSSKAVKDKAKIELESKWRWIDKNKLCAFRRKNLTLNNEFTHDQPPI
jgi:hypothetical protein